MAVIMIQTDSPSNVLMEFVEAARKFGHVSTGWTSPMVNPMIKIQGIEISDFLGTVEDASDGHVRSTESPDQTITTHETARRYASDKLHGSEV